MAGSSIGSLYRMRDYFINVADGPTESQTIDDAIIIEDAAVATPANDFADVIAKIRETLLPRLDQIGADEFVVAPVLAVLADVERLGGA